MMLVCSESCLQCRWEARWIQFRPAKRVVIEHTDLIDAHGVLNMNDIIDEEEPDGYEED